WFPWRRRPLGNTRRGRSSPSSAHLGVDGQAIARDALAQGAARDAEQLRRLHLVAFHLVQRMQDHGTFNDVKGAEAVPPLAGLDQQGKDRTDRRLDIAELATVVDVLLLFAVVVEIRAERRNGERRDALRRGFI